MNAPTKSVRFPCWVARVPVTRDVTMMATKTARPTTPRPAPMFQDCIVGGYTHRVKLRERPNSCPETEMIHKDLAGGRPDRQPPVEVTGISE